MKQAKEIELTKKVLLFFSVEYNNGFIVVGTH